MMHHNKYEQVDIVRTAAHSRMQAKLLHSGYDPFFKVAAGLDIADQADGNVESTAGWYAFIDMTGDKHDEVVAAVYDLAPAYDEEQIPGSGFYVTQENEQGLIFVYEFPTRETALSFYGELDAAYDQWMMESPDRELQANDYIWIAAWGKMLSSFPYYIEREQQIAVEEGAPLTTVYREPRLDPSKHNLWHTLEMVVNQHTRQFFIDYASNRNLALPDSVMEAWGLNKSDKENSNE